MSGLAAIKELIPHRYPMLLLDRVVDVAVGSHIVAAKSVTCNEPCYRKLGDDTPDRQYTYPSALLLESWCQAALVLAMWGRPAARDGEVAVLGATTNVELHADVLPGDVLLHEVRVTKALRDSWLFEGRSVANERPVLSVQSVLAAVRPRDVLGASC